MERLDSPERRLPAFALLETLGVETGLFIVDRAGFPRINWLAWATFLLLLLCQSVFTGVCTPVCVVRIVFCVRDVLHEPLPGPNPKGALFIMFIAGAGSRPLN